MSARLTRHRNKTWNPVRGCSRVSLGCGGPGRVGGCYAERQAHRFNFPGGPYEGLTRATENGPRWTGVVRLVPEALDEPLRWRKPVRVFVNSMSDLFHESLPDEAIARVFAVMGAANQHTFQILTKRPEWMLRWATDMANRVMVSRWWKGNNRIRVEPELVGPYAEWPLPNVWLGVSVEDQATADERIPLLLQTPAAVRFVSYEPALGPVDFGRYYFTTLPGREFRSYPFPSVAEEHRTKWVDLLDWIIVGGESGPGARPMDIAWPRTVRDQCAAASTAYFYKQGGASNRCPHDAKGGHFECFPEDLRVREFPKVREDRA